MYVCLLHYRYTANGKYKHFILKAPAFFLTPKQDGPKTFHVLIKKTNDVIVTW